MEHQTAGSLSPRSSYRFLNQWVRGRDLMSSDFSPHGDVKMIGKFRLLWLTYSLPSLLLIHAEPCWRAGAASHTWKTLSCPFLLLFWPAVAARVWCHRRYPAESVQWLAGRWWVNLWIAESPLLLHHTVNVPGLLMKNTQGLRSVRAIFVLFGWFFFTRSLSVYFISCKTFKTSHNPSELQFQDPNQYLRLFPWPSPHYHTNFIEIHPLVFVQHC